MIKRDPETNRFTFAFSGRVEWPKSLPAWSAWLAIVGAIGGALVALLRVLAAIW